MNKATMIFVLVLLAAITAALAVKTPPASAQFMNYGEMQVYVRNKPLNSVQVYGGEIYAPIGDFLRALKFSATQGDDGVVHISSDPGTIDSIQPRGGLSFEYNGTTFTVPFKAGQSSVLVELRRMSANLGASFIVSKETGIIDIVVPQGMSAKQYQTEHNEARMRGDRAGSSSGPSTFGPSQAGEVDRTSGSTGDMLKKPVDGAGPTGDQSKAGMSTGPVETPGSATGTPTTPTGGGTTPAGGTAATAEESPIKQIGELAGFADDKTGQCWWNATVKNTGDQVVNNVIITLHIADVAGKDYDTQIKPVGNMNPGDQSKLEFYWQGMRKMIINPRIEIKNDPLPKKEEKPAATPQKQQPQQQPATK